MISPLLEAARVRALLATGLLDSAPEPGFDRLTRLAATLVDAPVALVSLVDDRRQFFKSARGLLEPWASRRETPLTHSFCQYVTRDGAPLVVGDAREHPLLRDSQAIGDLGAIAYAGVPLVVDGQTIGALCVIDGKPREWRPEQVALLQDLAASVVSEIELRLALQQARDARALTDAVVESIGDACMAIDADRNFLVINQAARGIFAAELGKPLPSDWSALHGSHKPDGSLLTPEEGALARGLSGQETNGLTFTLQKPGTAQPIWVEVSGRPVRDGSGRVVAAVAVYRDVTERKQQLRQLRRSDQINRAILQHLPNGAVFLLDRDLRYVSAEGPLVPDIMRRTDIEGLVGRRAADVISPANREVVLDRYRRALAGESSDTEIELDGRYFDMSIVPILEGKEITHALIATYDVTDRRREVIAVRQARDALTRERALFEITLAHILDGVALIDGDNRILLANHAFAAMLGLAPESVLGLTREGFVRLVAPLLEQPEGFAEALAGQPEDQSQEFIFAPPRRRILTRSWTRVPLADGGGILVTWHDVTAERDLLRERERLLLTDLLTGIPNRRAADLALRTERERMKRAGTPMCVALFDIDHFKKVNDGHGHGAGDELLRLVAGTLAREARLTDTIARWGGEEFLAILNFPLDGARVFCERARLSVERLCCPPLGRVTISAGVAEVAAGESSSDAIAQADRHLYDAKNAGRNRVAG